MTGIPASGCRPSTPNSRLSTLNSFVARGLPSGYNGRSTLSSNELDAVLRYSYLVVACAVVLAACGRDHSAKADTTAGASAAARRDSSAGDVNAEQGSQEKARNDTVKKTDTAKSADSP